MSCVITSTWVKLARNRRCRNPSHRKLQKTQKEISSCSAQENVYLFWLGFTPKTRNIRGISPKSIMRLWYNALHKTSLREPLWTPRISTDFFEETSLMLDNKLTNSPASLPLGSRYHNHFQEKISLFQHTWSSSCVDLSILQPTGNSINRFDYFHPAAVAFHSKSPRRLTQQSKISLFETLSNLLLQSHHET